jgi:hypothetical protein
MSRRTPPSPPEPQWRAELRQWGLRPPHPSLTMQRRLEVPSTPVPPPPGVRAVRRRGWAWAAVAGAVALGVGGFLGGSWRPAPHLTGGPTAYAAVAPGAPYRVQHLWTLTVPPAENPDVRLGTLVLPRHTTLTPMALAQIVGTVPTGAWIIPRGGPVLWHWTARGPSAIPVPAAAAAPVKAATLLATSQRTDGHSVLVTVQDTRVTAHAWPIPVPAVWGPGFGATSGIAVTPQGAAWIAGGLPIAGGAPPVPTPHGVLAPLFHPILARVRPSGQVLQETVLRGLTVGAVTALTRAPDGSLWFGINTGPYDRTDVLFRGDPMLVQWDPATNRVQRYLVPASDRSQAIIDQIILHGTQVWLTLQHSTDGTDWGRPQTVWQLNAATGQWRAVPTGGDVFAWTVTAADQLLAVVQQDGLPPRTEVTLGGHPVALARSGATIAGVGVQGSRVLALLVPATPNPRQPVPVQVIAFRPAGSPSRTR